MTCAAYFFSLSDTDSSAGRREMVVDDMSYVNDSDYWLFQACFSGYYTRSVWCFDVLTCLLDIVMRCWFTIYMLGYFVTLRVILHISLKLPTSSIFELGLTQAYSYRKWRTVKTGWLLWYSLLLQRSLTSFESVRICLETLNHALASTALWSEFEMHTPLVMRLCTPTYNLHLSPVYRTTNSPWKKK